MTRLADVEATRILNGFQRDARAMLEQLLPSLRHRGFYPDASVDGWGDSRGEGRAARRVASRAVRGGSLHSHAPVNSWLPRGVAQLGSAFGSGPKGRRFESGHPDRHPPTFRAAAGSVRSMPQDWSADIAIAPDGALQKIGASINRRKKRAFGVLKTENEYVGFIREDTFEIWERQGRAVHGRGAVRARRGGSRVEVRLMIPRWTK